LTLGSKRSKNVVYYVRTCGKFTAKEDGNVLESGVETWKKSNVDRLIIV
jgi:hypothetical protein